MPTAYRQLFSTKANIYADVVTIYVLSFLVRIYGSSTANFKIGPLNHASKPLLEMLTNYPAESPHPPLFYVVLHFWIDLFGSTETSVRMLGLIAGAIAAPALYCFGREIDSRRTGIYMGLVAVFIPSAIYFSWMTRMYSFVLAFTSLSFWSLVRMNNNPTRMNGAYYVASTAALFYSQVLMAIVIPIQLLWIALNRDTDKMWAHRRYWGSVFGSLALITGVWVPNFVWHVLNFSQPIENNANVRNLLTFNTGGLYGLLAGVAISIPVMAVSITGHVSEIFAGGLDERIRLLNVELNERIQQLNTESIMLLLMWVSAPVLLIGVGFSVRGAPYRIQYALPTTVGTAALYGYLISRYRRWWAVCALFILIMSFKPLESWLLDVYPGLPI